MNKIITLLGLIFLTGFFSCKSDFELNAEWKDITQVYGILNQSDSAHYIKVCKVFSGNQSAYVMAAEADSVNYQVAEVYLQEYKNNIPTNNKFYFDTTTEISKLPGAFSTKKNILYKSKAVLDPTAKYKLHVYLPGKHVTAQTGLINDFYIVKPTNSEYQQISFESSIIPYRTEWKSAVNGKVYEMAINFHYIEVESASPNAFIKEDSILWILPSVLSTSTMGGETMRQEIGTDNFYRFIASELQPNSNVKRIAKKATLDFILTVGGDDLNTYLEVSRPSDGLVQDKPTFTNVENGIGIFSCRYSKAVRGKQLTMKSVDSLSLGVFTKHLGFYNSSQTSVYWSQHP